MEQEVPLRKHGFKGTYTHPLSWRRSTLVSSRSRRFRRWHSLTEIPCRGWGLPARGQTAVGHAPRQRVWTLTHRICLGSSQEGLDWVKPPQIAPPELPAKYLFCTTRHYPCWWMAAMGACNIQNMWHLFVFVTSGGGRRWHKTASERRSRLHADRRSSR